MAALGLMAASFLSFPVATFFSLAMLLVVLSSGTLAESVDSGSVAAGNAETARRAFGGGQRADSGVQGLLAVISVVKDYSPIDALSTGRSITWGELGAAFAQVVLLVGGGLPWPESFFSTGANWPRRREPNEFARQKNPAAPAGGHVAVRFGRLQNSLNHDRETLA